MTQKLMSKVLSAWTMRGLKIFMRKTGEKRKKENKGEGENGRNKKKSKPTKGAQTVPAPAIRKSKECKAKNQDQIEKKQ